MVENPPLTKDVWELYHVDQDFSEANNLLTKIPRNSRSFKICL